MRLALLLLFAFSSHSQTLLIDRIEVVPEFDINFILSDSLNDTFYINLNCQYFLQKYDFYHKTGQLIIENYININECAALYENITLCIESSGYKCIDFDNPFEQSCRCKRFY